MVRGYVWNSMASSDIIHTELYHCQRNTTPAKAIGSGSCYYGLECRMLARVIGHNYNKGHAPAMTSDEIKRAHTRKYHSTLTREEIVTECPCGPRCILYLNEDMDYEYKL